MLGFIAVKLRVRDKEGQIHKTNECLYFAEGVNSTLVSLRALKNLRCVPEHWPLPAAQVCGLTERVDMEEDVDEVVIDPRQPTPYRPCQPTFLFTEENIPKLKSWLIEAFAASSFNISSAPMAKM